MSGLEVLLIADDPQAADLVAGALRAWGDTLHLFANASAAMKVERPVDVALIDLEVQRGAGLALLHFFRARDPDLAIVAFTPADDLETAAVAHSLGVNATVPKPLTGDAVLVALSPVREKKAALALASTRRTRVPSASVLYAAQPRALAEALAHAAAEITGGPARVLIEDAREGEVAASSGDGAIELMSEPDGAIALVAYEEPVGTLYISPQAPGMADAAKRQELDQAAQTAATIGVLLRRIDGFARVGIKDPETSAYTFAYFVDVAGREIDRARRYDRRFGLVTFQVENYTELRTSSSPEALREARRELVDTILDAVRDSDILAHVEDDELYLLLPETGMLGALACRRRIVDRHGRRAELARLEQRTSTALTVGVAAFPRDGRDLGSLLRAAHTRGNASRESVAATLRRESPPGLEALLGAMLRHRPSEHHWQIRQAAVSPEAIASIAGAVAREATVGEAVPDGVMYLVGDRAHPLVRGAYEGCRAAPGGGVPSYWLRPRSPDGRSEVSAHGVRMVPVEIEVDGGLIGPFALLVVLSEAWAYACVASGPGSYIRMMHSSELEIVEALVDEIQTTFHLQRGIE